MNLFLKHNPQNAVSVNKIINQNTDELIGEFNSLKVRDWILFELEEMKINVFPLKIRFSPIKKNELIYSVGWGELQKDNSLPKVTKMQCIRTFKHYCLVKPLDNKVKPNGRSGSAVIDENGYLIGIISGGEGNLGVIGTTNYLREQFDKYGIKYKY